MAITEPYRAGHCVPGLQGDIQRHQDTLHMACKHIVGELSAIVKSLLGKATREDMLRWLGAVIEGNMERAKMQMDAQVSGSGVTSQSCSIMLCTVVLA